jgi:hypothetical protein
MAHDHTREDSPAHTPGTPRGENVLRSKGDIGFKGGTRVAADASSINLQNRRPIHPSMPHLPPV